MSSRFFFFVVVLCATSIAAIHGVPVAGADNNRAAQLQHLKQQFELFKRELDQVLAEGSSTEEIAAPVEDAEVVETEERCECDESSSSSEIQKRCPNGCGKKKSKTPAAVVDVDKRCQGCDDMSSSDIQKRCPNGCKKTPKKPAAAPVAAVAVAPVAAPVAAPVQDSPIMKRFLNVLPAKEQELIQHSGSKKQFIDRLLRRSHAGPNKEDMESSKVATPEVASTEERSLPVKDSGAMADFKRGLNSQQQQLLKSHNSKAQSIRGLLERKADGNKRQSSDPIVAQYVQTLTDQEKALLKAHPSSKDDLKAALLKEPEVEEGTAEEEEEEVEEKRGLSSAQVQATINKLANPADRALVQKHLSKIENVATAETRPVGSEEVSKRKLSSAQIESTLNKLSNPSDRAVAQKHLSKIENLAEAETRPVGSEEANAVIARLVNDIRLAKKGGVNLENLIDALKSRVDASKRSVKQ